MKTVLCFGDSNTYGLNPKDNSRFDYDTRWTGILDKKLRQHGFRVVEEGLCGRTTIYNDPLRPNRKGIDVLPFLLESHSPIEYAILMLGTNDCKTRFNSTPQVIADGIKQLINQIRNNENTKILLISPIHLADNVGDKNFDPEFNEQSVELAKQLKQTYSQIAKAETCLFLAASDYAEPSEYDREHMNENGHSSLANGIFSMIYNEINK